MLNFSLKTSVFIAAFLGCGLAAQVSSCSLDARGEAEKVDVLILGAGISGIAAARTLEVNGVQDFLVLEASDRVGGRIREYDGTNIEVGANWIHGLDPSDPNHHPIWREWRECDEDGPGGSITPDFTAVYDVDGMEIDINDENGPFLTRLNAFNKAYEATFELDASVDTTVRQGLTMEGWETKDTLDNFIEWSHIDFEVGLVAENISLVVNSQDTAYSDFTESDGETEDYLVVDGKGYSYVVKCLARNFIGDRVKLNSTVTEIKVADDCVCAQVKNGGMYCGARGIVTFSAGVLQAAIRGDQNSVQFEPPLPQWKQDAINYIAPVYYGKIYLVFPTRFWNETDVHQQLLGYVSDEKGYYSYYILDKNRPNTIVLDVTQNLAIKIATQSEEETINEVMVILRKIFNNDNLPQPERHVISKWHLDPLFLHSYSAFRPGAPKNVFDELLKPVNDRLYFAGEALNSSNYGYTQGGYGTGVYAAKQISMSKNGSVTGSSGLSFGYCCGDFALSVSAVCSNGLWTEM